MFKQLSFHQVRANPLDTQVVVLMPGGQAFISKTVVK